LTTLSTRVLLRTNGNDALSLLMVNGTITTVVLWQVWHSQGAITSIEILMDIAKQAGLKITKPREICLWPPLAQKHPVERTKYVCNVCHKPIRYQVPLGWTIISLCQLHRNALLRWREAHILLRIPLTQKHAKQLISWYVRFVQGEKLRLKRCPVCKGQKYRLLRQQLRKERMRKLVCEYESCMLCTDYGVVEHDQSSKSASQAVYDA
jgi:hypothetical protein